MNTNVTQRSGSAYDEVFSAEKILFGDFGHTTEQGGLHLSSTNPEFKFKYFAVNTPR